MSPEFCLGKLRFVRHFFGRNVHFPIYNLERFVRTRKAEASGQPVQQQRSYLAIVGKYGQCIGSATFTPKRFYRTIVILKQYTSPISPETGNQEQELLDSKMDGDGPVTRQVDY